MPAGRPTKFDPSYCDEMIEDGKLGYSLTAFAGKIGVARSTINQWGEDHPEFSEAIKRHAAARTRFLEGGLLSSESGSQVTSRIFALKNAAPEEWREKQEVAHSGEITFTIATGVPRANG